MTNYFVQDSTGSRVAKLQKILNPRTRVKPLMGMAIGARPITVRADIQIYLIWTGERG
jgi:hypothetical protein